MPDWHGQYTILASFNRKNRVRCDLDNLLKLVLDACNTKKGDPGLWGDDAQVVEIHAKLIRGDARPRTALLIRRTDPK